MVDYQNILHLHSVLSKILINFVNDILVCATKINKILNFILFYFHSQCFSVEVPDSSTSPSKTPILLFRKESFPFVEDDLYITDPRGTNANLSF